MRRRDFTRGLGLLAALPALARAQPGPPAIGFLHSGAAAQNGRRIDAFRKGLAEQGFVEGRNLAIAYRWGDGDDSRLPALAADLAGRNLAVLFGDTRSVPALRAAASNTPIVFAIGTDPVALGYVQSFNRPGGRLTGATSVNAELAAKRLGVLRDLVPQARHYYALVNPTSALTEPFTRELAAAAQRLDLRVELLQARSEAQIEEAFAQIPARPGTALILPPDSFFYVERQRIAALAAGSKLPACFDVRDYVDAGGLVSYGSDFLDVMRLAGNYVGRILKGENPSDLPVQRTTRFELVINMKTAKALGLEVPPRLLSTADDVVE